MQRRNIVILAVLGVAALIFVGGAWFYLSNKNARLDRQTDMETEAPALVTQGASSNLFVPGAHGRPDDDDITGYPPTYLIGAITQLFGSINKNSCDADHVKFNGFFAHCSWVGGSLSIESNTMPASMLHKKANKFDESGRPLTKDGIPSNPSNHSAMSENLTYISFDSNTSDSNDIRDGIVRGLTSYDPRVLGQQGVWTLAKEPLGYKTCYVYKSRTSVNLTCYQNS